MPLVQVVIDDSTTKTITGYYLFDRDNGGTLIIPSGSSLPGTPSAKELFWNTTDDVLYRRNDGNTAWDAVAAVASPHTLGGSSHTTDTLANLNSKISDATLDDSSDPRTPTSHASSHQSGGADSIKLDDFASPDDNTDLNATVSAHGLLPKLGGGTTNFLRADGTWSAPPGGVHALGGSSHSTDTLANLNSKVSDATLDDSSDPRTPTTHATSHQSGGSDSIKLDDLASPDDNTDLDATISAHGLLPKLGGGTTNYLRADGTWAAPSGMSAHALGGAYHTADTLANLNSKISDATLDDSSSSRTPTSHASTHQSGGADSIKLDDLASPDDNTDLNATTSAHGLLPKLGGGSTNYLRADGTWQNPSSGSGGFPTDYMYGFATYNNATNPNYQFDIEVGTCRSDDDTTDFATSSTITIDITSSGANGLDTGSEAAWTWYHIYVIYNPTTTTYAGLFSISATSPTMPSGYTKKRRIGSVINDGSSNFKRVRCVHRLGRDRVFMYTGENENDVQILSAASATSWTDVYCGASIPLTSLMGMFVFRFSALNYDHKVFVRPKGVTEDSPVTTVYAGDQVTDEYSTSSLALEMEISSDRYIQYKHASANNELSGWVLAYIEYV